MSENKDSELKIPPLPKSKKGQKTRQKILQAARLVFAEKGFAKASAEEISQKAEVGYGTFYLYFKDKRQALYTILSEVDDKLYRTQEEILENKKGLGALPTIKSTIKTFFENFEANADILKICQELSATDPEFKEEHDKIRARLTNKMKEHLLKGQKLGNARNVDPEIASVALAGLIETISNDWFFNNKNWDKDKVIKTISVLYYNAVIKN